MNIFLVPYTWTRHLVVGFFCAGVGILTWFVLLVWMVLVGPYWTEAWDGAFLLGGMAASIAGGSVLAEGMLRRRNPFLIGFTLVVAVGASGAVSYFLYWFWMSALAPYVFSPLVDFAMGQLGWFTSELGEAAATEQVKALQATVPEDIADPSLVSLRYRLGAYVMAGLATAVGPIFVRKFQQFGSHVVTGLISGLLAAGTWHLCNFVLTTDLYVAGASAGAVWGLSFGLFAWNLPDALYAGWIRVLSRSRFGVRIPIDARPGDKPVLPDPPGRVKKLFHRLKAAVTATRPVPKERFIGHFPRGLDLFLPVEDQVVEMHLSVAVDAEQRYCARGLTLMPTMVRRFLERVDLRYDPRRPAPLETSITSGDRFVLGQGPDAAELEFLMLPREER